MVMEDEGFWQWLRRKKFEIGAKARSPDEIQDSFREKITPKTLPSWVIFNTILVLTSFFILFILKPYAPFVIDVLLSIPLFYYVLTIHEFMHGSMAVLLGYQIKFNYGSTAVVSVLHENDSKWKKDSKSIALAPYFLNFPMGIFFILAGILGILVPPITFIIVGISIIITHIIFLPNDLKAIGG